MANVMLMLKLVVENPSVMLSLSRKRPLSLVLISPGLVSSFRDITRLSLAADGAQVSYAPVVLPTYAESPVYVLG